MRYIVGCVVLSLGLLAGCSKTDDAVEGIGTPCENGFAGEYPCSGISLMSRVSLDQMDAEFGNDCWGWTDAATGKEYALMGLRGGTAFIDVSNPVEPVYLGKLPTQTQAVTWRDVKVYDHYAFVVSEAADHGLQVFDLTRLRGVSTPQVFTVDAVNEDFGGAHNVVINEEKARVYVVGADTYNSGPHIIDVSNPLNPVTIGGYAGDGYTHDAAVITYRGPDPDYQGREIFAGSNEDSVTLVDVTDAANPTLISKFTYSSRAYTHQGWFTDDQAYYVANDELDELSFGLNTRSLIFDVSDLDNPVQVGTYSGPTKAIDHNYYIRENKLYLSNYTAGLRKVDISGIANGQFTETAFFDTYPQSDETSFEGAWSNYPYFESGNILISDMQRGLFVVKAME